MKTILLTLFITTFSLSSYAFRPHPDSADTVLRVVKLSKTICNALCVETTPVGDGSVRTVLGVGKDKNAALKDAKSNCQVGEEFATGISISNEADHAPSGNLFILADLRATQRNQASCIKL